jgi:ABC-type dipeptide/oligopeptide/nickel transport system ATPase component
MILELTNISVNYRRPDKSLVTAVDGVSLTLNKSEILGLVGESGSGRSWNITSSARRSEL